MEDLASVLFKCNLFSANVILDLALLVDNLS